MSDDRLKKLVGSYQPNKDVLEAMKQINLLATVGPSASGKTTVMNRLSEIYPHAHFVLDETSRVPRKNEQQGVDFRFRRSQDILEDLQRGDLVQIALGPNNDLYCTRLTSYPEAGVGMLALIPPAVKEFRKLPVGSFRAAFIVPKNYETWLQWLDNQAHDSDWSDEQKKGRLAEAKLSYEFALSDKKIHFVLNDTVDKAALRLQAVCQATTPPDENRARQIAKENYKKLVELL
ncbi:MAG TPA: hypothetical protein VFP32_00930 [Candidatus Saccharimonadales bacterium]|nr:hypothetical protein [Candidatus Saccharimonadales bacterium]